MCALPKAEVKKKTVGVDIRSTSLMVTGGEEEVEVLGHLVSGRRGAQRSSLGGKHPGSSSLIWQSHQEAVTFSGSSYFLDVRR